MIWMFSTIFDTYAPFDHDLWKVVACVYLYTFQNWFKDMARYKLIQVMQDMTT